MDLIKLGKMLKSKRNVLGLSLRDASELIGISHNYLSILEKAKDPRSNSPIRPTIDTLQLISKSYNLDLNELLELAGYDISITTPATHTTKTSPLTSKDQREIEKILEQTRESLEKSDGLMLSGDPVSPEAIESILGALEFGMRQAKVINKKYTPKKYRKDDKDGE